jgi:hypothetical protein
VVVVHGNMWPMRTATWVRTSVVKLADPPKIIGAGGCLVHVASQCFNAMLTSHQFGFFIGDVGPVSEGKYTMMIIDGRTVSFRNGGHDLLEGVGTARDLDVVFLSSAGEVALAEGSTKVGDMVAVEGPVVATGPGGVEKVNRQLGNGEAVGLSLLPQRVNLDEGGRRGLGLLDRFGWGGELRLDVSEDGFMGGREVLVESGGGGGRRVSSRSWSFMSGCGTILSVENMICVAFHNDDK